MNTTGKVIPLKRQTNVIRFLLLYSFAGIACSSLLVYLVYYLGLFTTWELITQVPENTIALVGGDPGSAYINTADNETLACRVIKKGPSCIPGVDQSGSQIKPCEKNFIAFLPIHKNPDHITYCLEMNGARIETSYSVVYAIDEAGNLWRWLSERNVLMFFFLLPAILVVGGLAGMLVGTLVWIISRLARGKEIPPTPLPKSHITILAIPWFCLLVGLIVSQLAFHTSPISKDSNSSPNYTAVAGTVNAQILQYSQQWTLESTPASGKIKYDFTQNLCDVKWSSGINSIICRENSSTGGEFVGLLEDPLLEGKLRPGRAISMGLSQRSYSIYGQYPVMEIQADDHFVTEIGCKDGSPICDLIFEVSIETPEDGREYLGRWSQIDDGEIKTIDLDLTRYAGRDARFSFSITHRREILRDNFQSGVWLWPRIEQSN